MIEDPPWIVEARKHIGEREIKGTQHNPYILRLWTLIRSSWFTDDETAWCAAYVGGCLEASGIKSTRSAAALSYKDYGTSIPTPMYGCIAVKPRFNAQGRQIGGHVTFVVGKTPYGALLCLGGNQGDAVSIANYPEKVFTTFRWPPGEWKIQDLPVIKASAGSSVKEA